MNEGSIILTDPEEMRNMSICQDIGNTLHKHYPGHLWAVMIQQGDIVIQNLNISTSMGMRLKMANYFADPNNRKVINFAGELLERAHLARGADKGDKALILEGAPENKQPTENIVR